MEGEALEDQHPWDAVSTLDLRGQEKESFWNL